MWPRRHCHQVKKHEEYRAPISKPFTIGCVQRRAPKKSGLKGPLEGIKLLPAKGFAVHFKSVGVKPSKLSEVRHLLRCLFQSYIRLLLDENNMVKPHGKLVPVRCICYHTCTAGLSTWSSPRFLQLPKNGRGMSHLEGGFPLRCFQRLSHPNVAAQHLPLAG